jgi:hypothetical protein
MLNGKSVCVSLSEHLVNRYQAERITLKQLAAICTAG